LVALVKLGLVFAAVLLLIRVKVPLGLSLILGAMGVALLFGMPLPDAGEAFLVIVTAEDTLAFAALVTLVMSLSMILKTGGQIERITESLRRFLPRRRFLSAALPAIVGFLPMPGGALFSAPMVDAAASGEGVETGSKILANHWFRHGWEFVWPLYPGLILAADVLGLSVGRIGLLQSPLTLAMLVVGTAFILRKIPADPEEVRRIAGEGSRLRSGLAFLLEMAPFLCVVVLHIALGLPLLLSLGAGIVWALAVNLLRRTAGWKAFGKAVLWNPHVLGFVVMAFGVKLFGGMLESAGALEQLGAFFAGSRIPVILVVVLLPAVVGLVSGITIVYVATAFPVLLTLAPVARDPVPFLVLAFAAGFLGALVSPIHACLVLACGYFKGSLLRAIAGMLVPAGVILACAFGWHLVLRAVL